jgi:apolipoprotein N-acyltransferase
MTRKARRISGLGASACSGLLLTASMPNFDLGLLGWLALVPLLLSIEWLEEESPTTLAMPFGLVWSLGVHHWYPEMFGPALGCLLIFAVGNWYALLIGLGIGLQRRLPGTLRLLALPVLWSALEFAKYIAPIVENWWFVLLAKSQWRFPPALQILSVTGFPGLSFLLMLSNVALAALLAQALQGRGMNRPASAALALVAAIVAWGAASLPAVPPDSFGIVATSDLANQDPAFRPPRSDNGNEGEIDGEDLEALTPEISQALFDVNAKLTREAANRDTAFVVWPENEFSDIDDPRFMRQLSALARRLSAYLVVDVVWRSPTGMHDTALMIGPNGEESGRRAKIAITAGEADEGFVAGPRDFPIFDTPHGRVGIGVCWDRHRLWITRELARAGAQIVLMPVDDDFNHSSSFPAFHASDAVFRAVENRVAFALGTTNGLSLVIDPYGRITAESRVNERMAVSGRTFISPEGSPYTRLGDLFGWLVFGILLSFVGLAIRGSRKPRIPG